MLRLLFNKLAAWGIGEKGGGGGEDLRGMKTFSSGARTNCIVRWANSAMYSSTALSTMSPYAVLYRATRMFRSTDCVRTFRRVFV